METTKEIQEDILSMLGLLKEVYSISWTIYSLGRDEEGTNDWVYLSVKNEDILISQIGIELWLLSLHNYKLYINVDWENHMYTWRYTAYTECYDVPYEDIPTGEWDFQPETTKVEDIKFVETNELLIWNNSITQLLADYEGMDVTLKFIKI